MTDVWARLVADRGGEVTADDGVTYLWSGLEFPFLNAVVAPAGELARAAAYLGERDQTGFVWVHGDVAAELIEGVGLQVAFELRSMTGEPIEDAPDPEGLELRRAETDEDLQTYGEINALAYDLLPAVGRSALAGSKMWLDEVYAYVGYLDGRPVTCAAVVAEADALVVVLPATVPEERGRGFAEAVIRRAVAEGARQTGLRRVVTHASLEAQPAYEFLGLHADGTVLYLEATGAIDEVGD